MTEMINQTLSYIYSVVCNFICQILYPEMPNKRACGRKLRSIFEAKENNTDPVCPNQHDLNQLKCKWPVRQKVKSIKRIPQPEKSAIKQSKENGAVQHVKNTNDEIRTIVKSADTAKRCVKKFSAKNLDVPKSNGEKSVDKSSENKMLSAVTQRLVNRCVSLIGAEKLYKCLKQAVDQPEIFEEQVEACVPVKKGKAMALDKTKNTPIVAEVVGKSKNENFKTSFEGEKKNEKAKTKVNAENLEKSNQKQRNETNSFQSAKCITSNLDNQVKDHNLPETENSNSLKKQVDKFVEPQQNYSLTLKELADRCDELSGRMLFIEDKFEKLQSPLYQKIVYNNWKEFLSVEFKSMIRNLRSFEKTTEQHQDICQFVTSLLIFLRSTNGSIFFQHTKAEVVEVHDNEHDMVKSFKDIVERLHYFGVLLNIAHCALMKLLIVKRLHIFRKPAQYWKKIGDQLRPNFDEEIFDHYSAAHRDLDIHDLAERVDEFIQASALKVSSEVEE